VGRNVKGTQPHPARVVDNLHSRGRSACQYLSVTYVGHAGDLWIGTRAGLSQRHGNKFTNPTKHGLANNVVTSVFDDSKHNLWIGTAGGGISRYRGGKFETFDTRRGLFNNSVLAFCEDSSSVLWIGTNGGGLNRFKDGRFIPITGKNGLFDDAIFRILDDDAGNLWIRSERGVSSEPASAQRSGGWKDQPHLERGLRNLRWNEDYGV
jgi:ligand-binding sensor domain-containing protein